MKGLNRAQIIGNLTRDPEMRYTPSGTAVVTFSVATNRSWKTESCEARDEAEFHRIVAWDKLAQICSQLLKKGSKVFVEGRIQTRKWQTADGQPRTTTEIVINDMIVLDNKGEGGASVSEPAGEAIDVPDDFEAEINVSQEAKPKEQKTPKKAEKAKEEDGDIPF